MIFVLSVIVICYLTKIAFADFLHNLLKLHDEYGNIFKMYVGHDIRIVISKPELLKEILTSNVHITKSNGYDVMKPWIAEGILTSTGNK